MKKCVLTLAVLASAVATSVTASAAPQWAGPGVPHPMHAKLAPMPAIERPKGAPPAASLAQWSGGFTDLKGHAVTYTMVGADPASSNTATHIKVYLIPVIFTYGPTNGNMVLNPKKAKLNGRKNIMNSLLSSPLFDDGADFLSGAIDCGQSQYIDAYQRCNFWSSVSTNTGYHTVLDYTKTAKPNKLKALQITVSSSQGSIIDNPFGDGIVGTYPINTFETAVHSYLTAHNTVITPDVFPFFVSYDVYLTQGGCCIGGYHNRSGSHGTGQTYGYTTIDDTSGAFSEDIGAASHEIGEWMDDPFVDNHVFCQDNSIMENGDPLVPVGNYGTFEQALNGYTWHPQSLVNIPYFGAPTSISANGWTALHNDLSGGVCPGQ